MDRQVIRVWAVLLSCMSCVTLCGAADAVQSLKLETETPTLHCLGFRWSIKGDDNRNASVAVLFRKHGAEAWRQALPLRRVETEALIERAPPKGEGLFAGSILFLEPDTRYEVKLELKDPDGGGTSKTVRQATRAEPKAPKPKRTLHVAPGDGGGAGTEADPFRGFAAADASVQPGDLVLVHAGTYTAPVTLSKSGKAKAPIVWRARKAGKAIIQGASWEKGSGLALSGRAHVFVEGLTVRKARYAIRVIGAQDIVIRRCVLQEVGTGVFGDGGETNIFVADNAMQGPVPFPKPKSMKIPECRGVDLSGTGHIVCYNSVRGFRDGIDTRKPWPVRAIDIHNNDICECQDDGIELDFSEHNTRAFCNRITNASTGISFQPIRGGPAYAVRNVLYNIGHETWKLHLTPTGAPHRTSGGVILHNTVVKSGPCFRVWSNEGPAHYYTMRNNLYVGIGGSGPIEITCPMLHADLDYDAYFHQETTAYFASWNKKRYKTREAFAKQQGQEKHGLNAPYAGKLFKHKIMIPDAKTAAKPVDLELRSDAIVKDKAEVLPSINDGFTGKAPDIGAYEIGQRLPHYGIRPAAK